MADSVLASLSSPALALDAPKVSGEPLHPAAERRQREAWANAAWPAREIRIIAVPDALVTHNGLAFRADGSPVAETANRFAGGAVTAAAVDFDRARAGAARLDGDAVLCMRPGATCYGHVLAEIMPAAWLVRRLLPHVRATLLAWTRPELLPLYREIADAAGADGVPLANCSAPVRVRRLLVVDGFAQTDAYLSPHVGAFAEDVLAALEAGTTGDGRRLFLPRRPGQGRSVRNLAAVEACVRRRGFETVYPEELPWHRQVALFRQATQVVGVQGSALTTTMFCAPGVRVLSLVPARMVDTFFWRIAGCRGLRYEEIRCPMVEGARSRRTGRLLDQDVEVDVELLDARLSAAGAAERRGMVTKP